MEKKKVYEVWIFHEFLSDWKPFYRHCSRSACEKFISDVKQMRSANGDDKRYKCDFQIREVFVTDDMVYEL